MILRLKIHTGPTQVNAVADRLEGLSRVRVTCRGTEHIYVNVETTHISLAKEIIEQGSSLPYLGNAVVSWAIQS